MKAGCDCVQIPALIEGKRGVHGGLAAACRGQVDSRRAASSELALGGRRASPSSSKSGGLGRPSSKLLDTSNPMPDAFVLGGESMVRSMSAQIPAARANSIGIPTSRRNFPTSFQNRLLADMRAETVSGHIAFKTLPTVLRREGLACRRAAGSVSRVRKATRVKAPPQREFRHCRVRSLRAGFEAGSRRLTLCRCPGTESQARGPRAVDNCFHDVGALDRKIALAT